MEDAPLTKGCGPRLTPASLTEADRSVEVTERGLGAAQQPQTLGPVVEGGWAGRSEAHRLVKQPQGRVEVPSLCSLHSLCVNLLNFVVLLQFVFISVRNHFLGVENSFAKRKVGIQDTVEHIPELHNSLHHRHWLSV